LHLAEGKYPIKSWQEKKEQNVLHFSNFIIGEKEKRKRWLTSDFDLETFPKTKN
jgi:hypothetical protein